MRSVILALFVLSLAAACAANEKNPYILPGQKLNLPQPLIAALAAQCPGFYLPVKADYLWPELNDTTYRPMPGWEPHLSPVWYMRGDTALPFVCWGDFNGDSLRDFALLLVRRNSSPVVIPKSQTHGTLAVCEGTPDGFRIVQPWRDYPSGLSNYYIQTRPAGKIKLYPYEFADSTVTAKYECIEWINWEGSANVWFWNKDHYEKIWTAD